MARWKRTSDEVKAKVTELKISNPELSSHDIEKQLQWTEWEVSNDTVCDIIKNLPQLATTEKGKKQIERLDTIISWIEEITAKLVNTLREKDEVTVNDVKALNEVGKTTFERKRLIEGDSTSNESITLKWEV